MRDPKEILTESGLKILMHHVGSIEYGIDYILNHADDLDLSDDQLSVMYKMIDICNELDRKG